MINCIKHLNIQKIENEEYVGMFFVLLETLCTNLWLCFKENCEDIETDLITVAVFNKEPVFENLKQENIVCQEKISKTFIKQNDAYSIYKHIKS